MNSNRTNLQYIILTALFTALTAVGAFIKIPVGPTPISAQLLFIALAGMILGPYWGALSQVLYVALGLAGLPIFTGGGGISYIYSPSFGFLLGFIFVPVIIGAQKFCCEFFNSDFGNAFLPYNRSSIYVFHHS